MGKKGQKPNKFSPAEQALIIHLKEVQKLGWNAIAKKFAKSFPKRRKGALQVHYCRRLSKRGTKQAVNNDGSDLVDSTDEDEEDDYEEDEDENLQPAKTLSKTKASITEPTRRIPPSRRVKRSPQNKFEETSESEISHDETPTPSAAKAAVIRCPRRLARLKKKYRLASGRVPVPRTPRHDSVAQYSMVSPAAPAIVAKIEPDPQDLVIYNTMNGGERAAVLGLTRAALDLDGDVEVVVIGGEE